MKISRFAIWAALSITSLAPSAQADTYPRQAGVDVVHYVFRLTLRDDRDEIVVSVLLDPETYARARKIRRARHRRDGQHSRVYACLAMIMNVARVTVPADTSPPLERFPRLGRGLAEQ